MSKEPHGTKHRMKNLYSIESAARRGGSCRVKGCQRKEDNKKKRAEEATHTCLRVCECTQSGWVRVKEKRCVCA